MYPFARLTELYRLKDKLININFYLWVKKASRALLVFMLVLMPYATLTPDPGVPSGSAPFLHLAGMAWVALLACMSFETIKFRAGAVLFVLAYSALMELFQHYLPYRHGTWDDVGINSLGCLIGVGIFGAGNRLRILYPRIF